MGRGGGNMGDGGGKWVVEVENGLWSSKKGIGGGKRALVVKNRHWMLKTGGGGRKQAEVVKKQVLEVENRRWSGK